MLGVFLGYESWGADKSRQGKAGSRLSYAVQGRQQEPGTVGMQSPELRRILNPSPAVVAEARSMTAGQLIEVTEGIQTDRQGQPYVVCYGITPARAAVPPVASNGAAVPAGARN